MNMQGHKTSKSYRGASQLRRTKTQLSLSAELPAPKMTAQVQRDKMSTRSPSMGGWLPLGAETPGFTGMNISYKYHISKDVRVSIGNVALTKGTAIREA